jgi:hypothetical protein
MKLKGFKAYAETVKHYFDVHSHDKGLSVEHSFTEDNNVHATSVMLHEHYCLL